MLLASSVISAIMGSYDDAICVVLAVGIVLTGGWSEIWNGARADCRRICAGAAIGKIVRSTEQGETSRLPTNTNKS